MTENITFCEKMRNYTFLEGQERFWVSKNQKLSFKPQPEMGYSKIFLKIFIPKDFENTSQSAVRIFNLTLPENSLRQVSEIHYE